MAPNKVVLLYFLLNKKKNDCANRKGMHVHPMLLVRIEKGIFHTLYNDLCADEKSTLTIFVCQNHNLRSFSTSYNQNLIFGVDLLLHHFHNFTYRHRSVIFHCNTNLTVYFQFPNSEVTLSSDGVRIIVGNSKMRMTINAQPASGINCEMYKHPKDTANVYVM